jgi:hypothetical protein
MAVSISSAFAFWATNGALAVNETAKAKITNSTVMRRRSREVVEREVRDNQRFAKSAASTIVPAFLGFIMSLFCFGLAAVHILPCSFAIHSQQRSIMVTILK